MLRPAWGVIKPLRFQVDLFRVFLSDYKRYRKFFVSDASNAKDHRQLSAWILQDKHRIEKGLSLPNVRQNFGKVVFERLQKNLLKYQDIYNKDDIFYWGVGAFAAYKKFHNENKCITAKWFDDLYSTFKADDLTNEKTQQVGTSLIKKSNLTKEQYKEFFFSRVSTRQFNAGNFIDNEQLSSIVQTAIKTPSVCNRQHWKAHIVSGDLKGQILALQNGNAGFGADAPQVAIITSSLKAFYMPTERVQGYTDGGMFAMSFLLSCHAHGVSTCALNWASSLTQDKKLRKLGVIKEDEVVIMLVALGYAADNAIAANSPRINSKEVLITH